MSCNQNTSNINKTFIVEGSGNDGFIEHTILSSYKGISTNDMYLIWGDLTIESGSTVGNDGRVVVVNGSFNNFGSYSGSGTVDLITTNLEYILNYGNETNGNLIYYTNSPSGWASGDTISSISAATGNVLVTKEWVDLKTGAGNNDFTTGATLVGDTIFFNRNDGLSAYTVDISGVSFSGGSGNCITDLYVTNINGCSPINIKDDLIVETKLILSGTPLLDNALPQLLVRDSATGEIKYRDADSVDTFVTGATLVNKELVLDRSDSLSAVTVDLSGLTSNAGAGLTYNETTGKIDLGGTLNNGTASNNFYFIPSTGANVINWGSDALGDLPVIGGSKQYISKFNNVSLQGEYKLIGYSNNSTFAGVVGCFEGQGPNVYVKQYKDISSNSITNSPDVANAMRTFEESDSPTLWNRTIWQSHNSNNKSYTYQSLSNFIWQVFDVNGYKNETQLTRNIFSVSIPNSTNTGSGMFSVASTSINLVDAGSQGITTFPNQTIVGNLFGSALHVGTATSDSKYEDASTNKKGIRLNGYGETNDDTGAGANYSTLVGTSLVPKKYVDDYVASTSANTFVTGTTFTNNQLNIALNNGTSVGTTIDNLSGLTVDGDVLVNGNVNIIGSATTINSEQVLIKDNIITLNSNATGSTTPVLDSGFEVLRGSGNTKSILWLESTDLWSIDDDLSVSGYVSGTTYYGDGSNLTGIAVDNTFVTGGTYSGSTIVLNRNDGNSVDITGITSSSIYTQDGTLTGNRTVDLDSNNLTLTGGTANFEFGGFWQGFTRWDSSGAVQIKSNGSGDPFKIYKKVDASNPNFVSGGNGGGHLGTDSNHWTVSETYGGTSTRIEIDSTYIKQYHGATLHHNNKLGGSGSGVQFFQGGISGSLGYFIVGGNTRIGTEKISLQEDTLVTKKLELSTTTDGFLMPRLTTAQMNAISSPDTHLKILNIDENREYRYNGSTWVSNEYVEYDFALRSSGSTTYYDNFYSCYNASVAGDVIDVQTDQTVDCGGITSWTWTNDITINLNGHHINCINLQRLYISTGVNVKMTNGTFSVESTSINTAAIMFLGGNTFVGDGAVTVYQSVGGSTRGSFTGAGARSTVSGVIMKGSATYCVGGFITVDNCILYKPTGGPETVYGDNVIVNNSIIYGPTFGVSGSYTIASRETVRVFNNCTIITDGESAIGSRSAIFNNCSIITNDDEVRVGIGGEQEFNNCKIERTGTVGTAFAITNTSNVRMYNTQIISTGTGVLTNRPMEFYNCYIKSNGGDGIINTTGAGMIIRGGTIDSTGGSCLKFSTTNVTGIAEVSNVTLVCNTTSKYCLEVNTNTTLTFSSLSMKNTATSNDIYSRAGIPSENTQIETTDAFGNIILK